MYICVFVCVCVSTALKTLSKPTSLAVFFLPCKSKVCPPHTTCATQHTSLMPTTLTVHCSVVTTTIPVISSDYPILLFLYTQVAILSIQQIFVSLGLSSNYPFSPSSPAFFFHLFSSLTMLPYTTFPTLPILPFSLILTLCITPFSSFPMHSSYLPQPCIHPLSSSNMNLLFLFLTHTSVLSLPYPCIHPFSSLPIYPSILSPAQAYNLTLLCPYICPHSVLHPCTHSPSSSLSPPLAHKRPKQGLGWGWFCVTGADVWRFWGGGCCGMCLCCCRCGAG